MIKGLFYIVIFVTNLSISAQQLADSIKSENLNEIVITATKVPTKKKNLGKIVYQITPEVIERNQGRSIVDLLNEVPGLEINGNYSTKGQNLGYYLRGGRNRQVAILIDGINVNDPSSFNGDFDLRQIPLDQVASIEVVKGAASTLYGTGAATGVINVMLKKASNKPFGGSLSTYLGTNNSQEDQQLNINELNTSINLNGTNNNLDYLISLSGNRSGGLSAAESVEESISFKEDPFNRLNTLVKLGYNVDNNFKLGIFGSYDEFNAAYDDYDFFTNSYVDAENKINSIQKRIGFTPKFKHKNGFITLNAFYTNINREVEPTDDRFEGEAYGFDIYSNYKFSDKLSLLSGLSVQYQDMYQKTAFSSIAEGSSEQRFYDPYVSLNFISSNGFNINAGSRLNIHDEYGNHMVYNVNPSFNFDTGNHSYLKILGSYSTAFVSPTLQEIFNKLPSIDRLKPEIDFTVEAGIEWSISKMIQMNAVYFYREETDKIGYDFNTFQTINDEGTFIAKGIEVEASYKPTKKVSFNLNYGFIEREQSLLLKIPKHKASINMSYNLNDDTQMTINGNFVDVTKDFGGISLPSYKLLDIFFNRQFINDRLTIFGSITNIFNENYQEIAGFSTRGRNYKVGLNIKF